MGINSIYLVLVVIFVGALFLSIMVFGTNSALRYKLLFFIAPFNAIVDVTISSDSPILGEIRGGILLLYVLAMIPYIDKKSSVKPVFWWLIYLIPLLFFSSNFTYSLYTYLKMSMGYMMIPIGYTLIKDFYSFKKMCISIAITAYVYVIGFIVYQAFGLGDIIYVENGFRSFGGGQAQFTQVLTYAVIAFPLTLRLNSNSKWKILHVLGHIFSALIVILVFHRSSMFAMVMGVFILGILGYKRTKIFKYIAAALAVSFLIFQFILPSYFQNFTNISESRSLTLQDISESKGGRGAEVLFFLNTFPNSSVPKILFGQELFNGGSLMKVYKSRGRLRPLHVDYIIVLLGAGIVGLCLYSFVYIWLAKIIYNLKKYFPPDYRKSFWATFIGLMAACLVMSTANQIWSLSSLCVVYLYFGGLIGFATGEKNVIEHDS